MNIDVMYSCAGCGLHRETVRVQARQEEPIVEWMQKVMAQAISNDHIQRSPHCPSRTMSEVLIPITGVDKIGGPALN